MADSDKIITEIKGYALREGEVVPTILGRDPFVLIIVTPDEQIREGECIPGGVRFVAGGGMTPELAQALMLVCEHALEGAHEHEHSEDCPIRFAADLEETTEGEDG